MSQLQVPDFPGHTGQREGGLWFSVHSAAPRVPGSSTGPALPWAVGMVPMGEREGRGGPRELTRGKGMLWRK